MREKGAQKRLWMLSLCAANMTDTALSWDKAGSLPTFSEREEESTRTATGTP